MKRRGIAIVAILLLGAFCVPLAGQEQKPASGQQGRGTGVVPPGVRLAPQMPAGAASKPFRFPQGATKTLANGLHVFVVPSSEEPAVTVRLVLTAAGAVRDPAGKAGVAAMTADLLTQGTEKRTAQQIAEAIDFVGGSLSASADSDGTHVTVTVVKKDFDLAMDLLSDVTLHATFQKEELERRRQQLLSALRVQYSSPGYLASVIFDRVVYGQHPYGLPDEGTPESAAKLERDDLVRFHDTYYVPNQVLLAFAGDITPAAAFAAAEKYLGAWPKKEVPTTEMPAPSSAQGLRIFLIDKPDAVQTQIRVGRPGIRRNSPDYIPLLVTNQILGRGSNSRLTVEVRQKKGLTYDARSGLDSRNLAGSFVASTFTRTEATGEATKLVVDLIRQMASGAVTKAELDTARDFLAGVFPIQSETAEQVAGRILNVAQFDLPADYNDTYQQKVRDVSAEQVKAMAAGYIDADSLDLVLVGKVSQFRDTLKKEFPKAKYEEIPFDQVDLFSADLRRPKEVAAAATPEALERGRAILKAAAEGAGGAALSAIESLEATTTGKAFTPQGELPIEVKVQVAFPDRIRVEVKLAFGTMVQGFDGKTGWVASPQGAVDLPAVMSAEIQRGIDLEAGLGLYRQALAGTARAQFVGEEEWDGKKALAVEWETPAGRGKLYFDPESRLLVGARYRQTTMQGVAQTEQRWSDFRRVLGPAAGAAAGIQLPYRWVTLRDGAKFNELTVQEVKLNTKPDPAIFTKPTR
jgi:zinc protease